MKRAIAVVLLLAGSALAQTAGLYREMILSRDGKPVSSAPVRVCQDGATYTPGAADCSPLAPIYSNRAMTTAIPQPGFKTDSLGNYAFYAPANWYTLQVTVGGVTTTYDITAQSTSGPPGVQGPAGGNLSIAGLTGSQGQVLCNDTGGWEPCGPMTVNVKMYGAKGDGRIATDATLTAGSAIVNTVASHFSAADVGRTVTVSGAGVVIGSTFPNQNFRLPLYTTIASYQSATRVTLTAAATAGVCPTVFSVSATRAGALDTYTTTVPHCFSSGQLVRLAGFSDDTFNQRWANIYTTPTASTFTIADSSSNTTVAAAGGTAQLTSLDIDNGGTIGGTRLAWATDDSTAIRAAQAACKVTDEAQASGCGLYLPPGHYFSKYTDWDCGKIAGSCAYAYHKITMYGDSRESTILENPDPTVDLTGHNWGLAGALVSVGGNQPIDGFSIHGLTLRTPDYSSIAQNFSGTGQLPIAFGSDNGGQTRNVEVRDVRLVGIGPPCMAGAPIGGTFHGNIVGPGCGWVMPGYNNTQAGINIMGFTNDIYGNTVIGSGQGYEGTGHSQTLHGNVFDFRDSPIGFSSAMSCYNMGSSFWDSFDILIQNNECKTRAAVSVNGGGVASNFGVFTDTHIKGNTFRGITGGFDLGSGIEQASRNTLAYTDGRTAPSPHGQSEFVDNLWLMFPGQPQSALSVNAGNREDWVVAGNKIQAAVGAPSAAGKPSTILHIGGSGASEAPLWKPSTAYGSISGPSQAPNYVNPTLPNGCLYYLTVAGTSAATEPFPTTCTVGATITDNTASWKAIKHGEVFISNNTALPTAGSDLSTPYFNLLVVIDSGVPDYIHFGTNDWQLPGVIYHQMANAAASYPASWWPAPDYQVFVQNATSSDTSIWWNNAGTPNGGLWKLGTRVFKVTPGAGAGGEGWLTTTAGRSAPAWVANTAYGYDVLVDASNGHVYRQITSAGCTSLNPGPPAWNAAAGSTTADSTCSWVESGATPVLTARP